MGSGKCHFFFQITKKISDPKVANRERLAEIGDRCKQIKLVIKCIVKKKNKTIARQMGVLSPFSSKHSQCFDCWFTAHV